LKLREHSHFYPENATYCAHCGQALPVGHGPVPRYGDQGVNRTGMAVTILLHLLLVLLYIFHPHKETTAPPPAGGAITYVAPLPGKPKQKELPKAAPKQVKPSKPVVAKIERLPNTITLPNEKPVDVAPEPPKEAPKVTPEMDMSEMIAARRRARGADSQQQSGEPSEAERGMNNALANIAAANGRSKGDDKNETGGVFSVTGKTFSTAELKFRGWNPNFKRRWLQQVTVELGGEPDIETAIVKKMIELIRKEKTGDFEWDSHRLQRVVTMSARVQDTAELQEFLYKEMFPEYRPRRK
jgi:hypothetical protein